MKAEQIIEHITQWLGDYLKKSKQKGFIIGVSGGIDSALSSLLAARSGAPLIALELPICQKKEQLKRSKEHIDFLKKKFPSQVEHLRIDLSSIYKSFYQKAFHNSYLKKEDLFFKKLKINPSSSNQQLALVNTKARLRMCLLYYYASLFNYLVVGTGNKIEDFGVGFFTKYGDGAVDISPIADLTKTQVRTLAKVLDIPLSIQKATPTDGLWEDDRSDEEQLGASYEELEWAMEKIQEGKSNQCFKEREKELIDKYTLLHEKNFHKINPIPVCKIPKKLL